MARAPSSSSSQRKGSAVVSSGAVPAGPASAETAARAANSGSRAAVRITVTQAGTAAGHDNRPQRSAPRLAKLPFQVQDRALAHPMQGFPMQQRLAVIAASLLGLAIGAPALAYNTETKADALVNEFVFQSLVLSPVTATYAG